jgi:hypothetical protein
MNYRGKCLNCGWDEHYLGPNDGIWVAFFCGTDALADHPHRIPAHWFPPENKGKNTAAFGLAGQVMAQRWGTLKQAERTPCAVCKEAYEHRYDNSRIRRH